MAFFALAVLVSCTLQLQILRDAGKMCLILDVLGVQGGGDGAVFCFEKETDRAPMDSVAFLVYVVAFLGVPSITAGLRGPEASRGPKVGGDMSGAFCDCT